MTDTLALRGKLAARITDKGRQRLAQIEAQINAHGDGPMFGDLAIGERFYWPPPIPRGPEPMVKSADDRYEWSSGPAKAGEWQLRSGGYGKAEDFYRVERWTPDAK